MVQFCAAHADSDNQVSCRYNQLNLDEENKGKYEQEKCGQALIHFYSVIQNDEQCRKLKGKSIRGA